MGLENLQYPVEEDFYKLETWNTNTKILADAITASNTEIVNTKNMIGDLSSLSTDDKTSAVLAINEMLATSKDMGLTGENLTNRQINDDFTFSDLVHQSKVTFFTNWTDNTNFPQIYGSGVLIPCLDPSEKLIFYTEIMTGHAYNMHVKLSGDSISVTTKRMTNRSNNVAYTPINISSFGTGNVGYQVKNGICIVTFMDFIPTKNGATTLQTNMPKIDGNYNAQSILVHPSSASSMYSIQTWVDANEQTLKMIIPTKSLNYTHSGQLVYPVAD